MHHLNVVHNMRDTHVVHVVRCDDAPQVAHSVLFRTWVLSNVRRCENKTVPACLAPLQKHVRNADCTATVADRRRTYGDRQVQLAIDRRPLQVSVVTARILLRRSSIDR